MRVHPFLIVQIKMNILFYNHSITHHICQLWLYISAQIAEKLMHLIVQQKNETALQAMYLS